MSIESIEPINVKLLVANLSEDWGEDDIPGPHVKQTMALTAAFPYGFGKSCFEYNLRSATVAGEKPIIIL